MSQTFDGLHVGPASSCLELESALLNCCVDQSADGWVSFTLPKGHGAMARFVVLEGLGVLEPEQVNRISQKGSRIGGHPHRGTPGIGASTDSLCNGGYGSILELGGQVADSPAQHGHAPFAYSAHTLKPLDLNLVKSTVGTYERVITLEEHVYAGGLRMSVRAQAQELGTTANAVETICLRDEFLHTYGSKDDLLDAHGISVQSILAALAKNGG